MAVRPTGRSPDYRGISSFRLRFWRGTETGVSTAETGKPRNVHTVRKRVYRVVRCDEADGNGVATTVENRDPVLSPDSVVLVALTDVRATLRRYTRSGTIPRHPGMTESVS